MGESAYPGKDVVASTNLSDSSTLAYLSGATFTGNITISKASGAANFTLSAASGTSPNQFVGEHAGSLRWNLQLGNTDAESSGNAGFNLALVAYADDGSTVIGQPLRIIRSDMSVLFAGSVSAAGVNSSGNVSISKADPILAVSGSSGNADIILNSVAGQHRQIISNTSGVQRWGMRLGNADGESSGNAGSNFALQAWNDAGDTILATSLLINRANSLATFAGDVTVSKASPRLTLSGSSGDIGIWLNGLAGQERQIVSDTSGAHRWIMRLGNSTAETGSNAGSDFSLLALNDAGDTVLATSLLIERATSKATFGGAIEMSTNKITGLGDPTAAQDAATKNYVDTNHINYVINGSFDVWQRGTSPTATDQKVTADMWRANVSGSTMAVTRQAFTPGDIAGSSQYYGQFVTASGSAAGDYAIIINPIEGVSRLAGKTITVSFWAKANTGTPKIAIEIGQTFGTGGSPSTGTGTPAGSASTISTSWARYTQTIAVPSISGKTLGTTDTTSYTGINFWLSAGSTYNARANSIGNQNVTFSIWGVQVQIGSTATDFQLPPLAQTLAMCQRYYYRIATGDGFGIGVGVCHSATGILLARPFPTTMRTTPTLDISDVTHVVAYDPTLGPHGSTNVTLNNNTTANTAVFEIAAATGLVAGNASYVATSGSTAYLAVTAEL